MAVKHQIKFNDEYWYKSEIKNIKKQLKGDRNIDKEIARNKHMATLEIQDRIDVFYGRYAIKQGMSMEQALSEFKLQLGLLLP